MNCPYCDIDMLKGYLNCGAALWSERKHKISLLPDGQERYALKLRTPAVSPNHIESYICPKCKIIIMDVNNYESNV